MLIHARRGEIRQKLEEDRSWRDDARSLSIWAKGYFFDRQGHLHCDGEIARWLGETLRTYTLDETIPLMNGCFTVVMVEEESKQITCATDRYGAVPVYYSLDGDLAVLSDDYWEVARLSNRRTYSRSSVLGMIELGYVPGTETLLEDIFEVPGGTILEARPIDGAWAVEGERYWRLNYEGEKRTGSDEDFEREFADLLSSVVRRFTENVNARDWSVAVALSGGKDSRLLVSLFKHYGCLDMSAFSYGPPQHPDVVCAAKIAQMLDVPHWVFPVEEQDLISDDLIREMSRKVGATTRFTCGLGRRLADCLLPSSSVYVVGHTGFRSPSGDKFVIRRKSQAARLIRRNHFICASDFILRKIWRAGDYRSITRDIIDHTLSFDACDPIGSMLNWYNWQRLRRLLLREVRAYEKWGHFMLPLLDYELSDYVVTLPWRQSMHARLYVNSMVSNVYTGDLVSIGGIPTASGEPITRREVNFRDQLKLVEGWHVPKDVLHLFLETKKALRQRRDRGDRAARPEGPDPFDYWWMTSPDFRARVLSIFEGWDGIDGMIDTDALLRLLRDERQLPRYFLRFGIPSLLTLVFVQRVVEETTSQPAPRRLL